MNRAVRLDLMVEGFMILQEGRVGVFAWGLRMAKGVRRVRVHVVTGFGRWRPEVELEGQVEAILGTFGGGVSAVVVLECEGPHHGGRLANGKILGFRCGGYDRRDGCPLEGRASKGSTDMFDVAHGHENIYRWIALALVCWRVSSLLRRSTVLSVHLFLDRQAHSHG